MYIYIYIHMRAMIVLHELLPMSVVGHRLECTLDYGLSLMVRKWLVTTVANHLLGLDWAIPPASHLDICKYFMHDL